MAQKFKSTRHKQGHALIFEWEGGEYINVRFPGCYDHDNINVWSGQDKPRIPITREAFKAEVDDYLKELDPLDLLTQHENRTWAGAGMT
jgi:hypothetical protein